MAVATKRFLKIGSVMSVDWDVSTGRWPLRSMAPERVSMRSRRPAQGLRSPPTQGRGELARPTRSGFSAQPRRRPEMLSESKGGRLGWIAIGGPGFATNGSSGRAGPTVRAHVGATTSATGMLSTDALRSEAFPVHSGARAVRLDFGSVGQLGAAVLLVPVGGFPSDPKKRRRLVAALDSVMRVVSRMGALDKVTTGVRPTARCPCARFVRVCNSRRHVGGSGWCE